MADINVEFARGDAPCVISVSGDVDIQAASALGDAGVAAIEQMEGACPHVVIDLGQVTFMDSTGLGALVQIRNAAIDHAKTVKLRGVPQRVAKILTMTGLEKAFEREADGPANSGAKQRNASFATAEATP